MATRFKKKPWAPFHVGALVRQFDEPKIMIIEDISEKKPYKALCSYVEDNVYYRRWYNVDHLNIIKD